MEHKGQTSRQATHDACHCANERKPIAEIPFHPLVDLPSIRQIKLTEMARA